MQIRTIFTHCASHSATGPVHPENFNYRIRHIIFFLHNFFFLSIIIECCGRIVFYPGESQTKKCLMQAGLHRRTDDLHFLITAF